MARPQGRDGQVRAEENVGVERVMGVRVSQRPLGVALIRRTSVADEIHSILVPVLQGVGSRIRWPAKNGTIARAARTPSSARTPTFNGLARHLLREPSTPTSAVSRTRVVRVPVISGSKNSRNCVRGPPDPSWSRTQRASESVAEAHDAERETGQHEVANPASSDAPALQPACGERECSKGGADRKQPDGPSGRDC